MMIKWMALAVLSLTLAGQALAQRPNERPDTGTDTGITSPGERTEGVERSTDTTGVDHSTGTPSGQQDPRGTSPETEPGTGGGTTPTPPPTP